MFVDGYEYDQIYTVTVDSFTCSFPADGVFALLRKIATAWGIKSVFRAKFVRKPQHADNVVSFDVPKVAKYVTKAVSDDELRPALNHVCIDTEKRVIIGSDGHIMTVASVPDMMVSEKAEKEYMITPDALKGGKGFLYITENDTVENLNEVSSIYKNAHGYANWKSVCPLVCENEYINLSGVWKEFAKEIKTATKFADKSTKGVILSGASGCKHIEIEAAGKVSRFDLPDAIPFDFKVKIRGTYISCVSQSEKLYFGGGGQLVFCFDGGFSMLMPMYFEYGNIGIIPQHDRKTSVIELCGIDTPKVEHGNKESTENEKQKISWNEIKNKHEDSIILCRVGDFYEVYQSDADKAHKVLNIAINSRNNIRFAAFPYHALDMYLPKLVRSGCCVVICESVITPTEETENEKPAFDTVLCLPEKSSYKIQLPAVFVGEYKIPANPFASRWATMPEVPQFAEVDTEDGREILPDPPAVVYIDMEEENKGNVFSSFKNWLIRVAAIMVLLFGLSSNTDGTESAQDEESAHGEKITIYKPLEASDRQEKPETQEKEVNNKIANNMKKQVVKINVIATENGLKFKKASNGHEFASIDRQNDNGKFCLIVSYYLRSDYELQEAVEFVKNIITSECLKRGKNVEFVNKEEKK